MTYKIAGKEIEARPLSFWWGLWTNTMTSKGIIYSKQYDILSRQTILEEYTHILQETEIGHFKFRWLYIWFWFARGFFPMKRFLLNLKLKLLQRKA